jgi:hypothetical protein
MLKLLKNKWILIFAIIIILTPLGIFLPDYFKAGDAWGEWSTEQVKEQTGSVPEGMKKDAELYKAPIADYTLNEESSMAKQSFYYILSAIIGVGIIFILSFGLKKLVSKNDRDPQVPAC